MPVQIAPSILSGDYARLADDARSVEEAGADLLHVDIMDGRFVPTLTWGPETVRALRRSTRLFLDVHLMMEQPDRWVDAFIDAGADCVSVHVEACVHLHRTLSHIRSRGVQVGVAFNPATPIEMLTEIAGDVDRVLVMTVNPGYGGQELIPATLDKMARLRRLLDERGYSALIEADGGVNEETVRDVVNAGATVLVAGSSIFRDTDRRAAINRLRQLIAE